MINKAFGVAMAMALALAAAQVVAQQDAREPARDPKAADANADNAKDAAPNPNRSAPDPAAGNPAGNQNPDAGTPQGNVENLDSPNQNAADQNAAANAQGERWRFQQHQGSWWYWTPSNTWVVYSGSRWISPSEFAGSQGQGQQQGYGQQQGWNQQQAFDQQAGYGGMPGGYNGNQAPCNQQGQFPGYHSGAGYQPTYQGGYGPGRL